jgi:hypothetical protein
MASMIFMKSTWQRACFTLKIILLGFNIRRDRETTYSFRGWELDIFIETKHETYFKIILKHIKLTWCTGNGVLEDQCCCLHIQF